MRLDFATERILAVLAHPDDAELLCAGTLARAVRDGAVVTIAALCRGDKGQPPANIADLAAVRKHEATSAASLLGAAFVPGFSADGELVDSVENRRQLVDTFLAARPSLVITHSPHDYHPDHQAAANLAAAASWFCASGGWSGKLSPLKQPPALWYADCINRHQFVPDFYLDVSDFVQLKEQMLRCHASQLARANDPAFVSLLDLMHNQHQSRGRESGVAAAEAFQLHHAFKRVQAW